MTDIISPAQRAEALEGSIDTRPTYRELCEALAGLVNALNWADGRRGVLKYLPDAEAHAVAILGRLPKDEDGYAVMDGRPPTAVMRSIEMAPTDSDGSPVEVRWDEGVGA